MLDRDLKVLAALHKAMCCNCGTVKTFLQGVLVGAALVALTSFVTIHTYRNIDGHAHTTEIHR